MYSLLFSLIYFRFFFLFSVWITILLNHCGTKFQNIRREVGNIYEKTNGESQDENASVRWPTGSTPRWCPTFSSWGTFNINVVHMEVWLSWCPVCGTGESGILRGDCRNQGSILQVYFPTFWKFSLEGFFLTLSVLIQRWLGHPVPNCRKRWVKREFPVNAGDYLGSSIPCRPILDTWKLLQTIHRALLSQFPEVCDACPAWVLGSLLEGPGKLITGDLCFR